MSRALELYVVEAKIRWASDNTVSDWMIWKWFESLEEAHDCLKFSDHDPSVLYRRVRIYRPVEES